MSKMHKCRFVRRGECLQQCLSGKLCPFSHVQADAKAAVTVHVGAQGNAASIAKKMAPGKLLEDGKYNRGEKCRFSRGAGAGSAAGAIGQSARNQKQFIPKARTKEATGAGDKARAVTSFRSIISDLVRTNKSNVITEENYYLLQWLYRIRRVGCARGIRIGFLQPDFLWVIYRPMMRSKKLRRTDVDIKVAVDLWCFDRAAAEERFGHISEWDVSSVTDMSHLFEGQCVGGRIEDKYRGKDLFNDDISQWDVSNVTNMGLMFGNARSFNQPVGDWDVSKVTNMNRMFGDTHSFNCLVGNWDVSNVTDMSYMFLNARSFNQAVGGWDVSNVTGMHRMFGGALSFNQAVGDWNVSKVTDMRQMFFVAQSFNQPVGDWDVSNVTDMVCMFYGASKFNQDLTRWEMRSVRHVDYMFDDANAMQRGNKPARFR